jgi:tRNA pseudouridine55 synthase
MNKVLIVNKKIGETPLDRIKRLKNAHLEYQDQKISYAGRLDPMAEGLLLLLVGEKNKQRHKFEHLDKKYLFQVLFGVSTDSFDILGKIIKTYNQQFPAYLKEKVKKELNQFSKISQQQYPPYSAKIVNGKPLYFWARQDKLKKISIPTHKIEIKNINFLSLKWINTAKLGKEIPLRINHVNGDFRQKKILDYWNSFFANAPHKRYPVVKASISCSSGTYVRDIANKLGRKINIPSLAYWIKRTQIGKYRL